METTTVIADETSLIEEELASEAHSRFSWSATLAGAFAAVATTLLLLTLGSGVGLALVSPARTARGAIAFLTLGGIYFLVAQAFGFAVGGHITGRLIGPQIETSSEENFRAGSHGLVLWALAVVASLVMVAVSSLIAPNSAVNVGALYGFVPTSDAGERLPATTPYWVDVLFRAPPQPGAHASLDGVKYAQADSGTGSDANTGSPDANPPSPPDDNGTTGNLNPTASSREGNAAARRAPADVQENPSLLRSGSGVTSAGLPPVQNHDLQSDKAEVGRILNVELAAGGYLSTDDRDRIAQLVAQDSGLSYEAATTRINDVQARVHNEEVRATDAARKIASYASLWIAFALFFGAIVAIIAAISARWEDDAQSMFPFARTTETRFS